jgi:hypothetical protein
LKTEEQILAEIDKIKKAIVEAENEAYINPAFRYSIYKDIEELDIELGVLYWVLDNKK